MKCIVIGSSGVGKTALTKRLVENVFYDHLQSTVGVEYEMTTLDIDGQKVRLNVWDTAGQEKFKSISRAYFREAVCVLLVFDLTDKQSFEDVNSWLSDVRQLCDPNAATILVANKSDLTQKRVISTAEVEDYARTHNLLSIETSAFSGENVREAFVRTAREAWRKIKTANSSENKLQLGESSSSSKGCC